LPFFPTVSSLTLMFIFCNSLARVSACGCFAQTKQVGDILSDDPPTLYSRLVDAMPASTWQRSDHCQPHQALLLLLVPQCFDS